MKLTCKLGDYGEYVINVQKSDTLSILMTLLPITEKKTSFIFKGISYPVFTSQTFEEIGLVDDTILFFNSQAIASRFKFIYIFIFLNF